MILIDYTYNIQILNSILVEKSNLLCPVVYSGDTCYYSDWRLDDVAAHLQT